MRTLRPLLLASTLVVAIVGGCLVYGWRRGAQAPAPVRAVAAVEPDIALFAAAPVSGLASPAPAPSSTPGRESLAAQVDRLSRSTDPVDAFAAYKLATACVWARDHEGWMARHILPGDRDLLPTAQSACGDIASDQIQSRLRWLERAALAGVHHAAAEMLLEGPDGLGIDTRNDIDAPENADWRQRIDAAVEAGVHTCDPEALDSRVNSYENGGGVQQDRGKALTYWIAYVDCRKRLDSAPTKILGNGDSVTRRMGDTLSAEQIATAVSAGQQLARDAQPLPGDH